MAKMAEETKPEPAKQEERPRRYLKVEEFRCSSYEEADEERKRMEAEFLEGPTPRPRVRVRRRWDGYSVILKRLEEK